MKTFLKLTYMELKLQLREPLALFFTLAFPVMVMVLFGFFFGNDAEELLGGYGQVDLSVPGYIGMVVGTIGLLSIPTTLANYRDLGILRRLRATPLGSSPVLWSQVAPSRDDSRRHHPALYRRPGHLQPAHSQRQPGRHSGYPAERLSFFAVGSVWPASCLRPNAQVVGMAVFYPMLFLSGAASPATSCPTSCNRSRIVAADARRHPVEDPWLKEAGTSSVAVSRLCHPGLVISRLHSAGSNGTLTD